MSWLVISTWKHSFIGIGEAVKVLSSGGTALLAVEKLICAVEDDPSESTVGFGGFPNREGDVECDAAIMDGTTLSVGAVAALRNFRHAISVARHVMEDTPHNMLAGQGADEFAISKGFTRELMLNEDIIKAYQKQKAQMDNSEIITGHDTVGVVAIDCNGNMACGTSTSGLSMKYHGRVGDSPLIGSGFYVDSCIGGACCTGVGENIMLGCPSFAAVERIRQGLLPNEIAAEVIKQTHNLITSRNQSVGEMAIVCADKHGNYAAAANHSRFEFCLASDKQEPSLIKVNSCISSLE